MERADKIEKHIQFAIDVKKQDATFTPSRKPHYSAIRKKWLKCCDEGEYEQLKQYLASCEQKGVSIKDFFLSEGRLILNWAVVSVSNVEPLRFICKNVPIDIFKEVLNQNGDYVVENFLLSQSGMDKHYRTDHERLKNRLEKFELLLAVDPEGIQAFTQKHISKKWISEGVKDSFSTALKQYERKLVF